MVKIVWRKILKEDRLKVFVGYDTREDVAWQVCKHSLEARNKNKRRSRGGSGARRAIRGKQQVTQFPYISRIRNKYQKNILIKIPNEQSLSGVKNILQKSILSFHSVPDFRSVQVFVDVDPY